MKIEKSIFEKYETHLEKINDELNKGLFSKIPLVEEIGNHSLLSPGKRIRPFFFVLSCELFDYKKSDIYRLSTIFEYIHTASLLHDDVLDNAETRRTKPAANYLWGNHAAVLVGDFLSSKAFSIALESNNMKLLNRFVETTQEMTEGQVLELVHTDNWNTDRHDYDEIIYAKTAVLISAACACGAMISGADTEYENALSKFGMNVGMAFQLMDDLLDYTSTADVFGKPVGKDIREGKITLPLIYTLNNLDAEKKSIIIETFMDNQPDEQDFADLIDLVRNSGAIEQVRKEAIEFSNNAAKCLEIFPDSPSKCNLLDLNRYVIERNH